MNPAQTKTLPLGDFLPSDQWQTHINSIFYGIKGPAIHKHFQTYVSLDYRLAHTIAEEFYQSAITNPPEQTTLNIQEWGVGNGNLAAFFLSRVQELDAGQTIYPKINYTLCDYSEEILNGVRANEHLQKHSERYSTKHVDASNTSFNEPQSVYKIISNEIWDDLATKIILKHGGTVYEEYIRPHLDPDIPQKDFNEFLEAFKSKNLEALKECGPFLEQIIWERDFQRADISDWSHAKTLKTHLEKLDDEIPTPINTGAFKTLEQAHHCLTEDSQGYSGFDYGMFSMTDLNFEGRPYFKLYGGQYTSMVNFPLLEDVGKAIGFQKVSKEYQHDYVGKNLNQKVISLVELIHHHPQIHQMQSWDKDILMLNTLHALNANYKSPYKQKMEYPPMPDTPKKQRKQIKQLAQNLSLTGVPDTVAYVTEEEVRSAFKRLIKTGYREKDILQAFNMPPESISFVHLKLQ